MVNDMGATVAGVLMRENAEMALSSAIGEQVERLLVLCGFITFILLVKRKWNSDARGTHHYYISEAVRCLCLICAFMYPAMRTVHGDKWKLRQPLNLICG